MKVFVYYNLHKKLWSIKAMEGPDKGRVIKHAMTVNLRDAKPKVSQAGRRRVLKEGRKNVHAGIVGELMGTFNAKVNDLLGEPVTYNPYKHDSFVYAKDTEQKYTGSDYVWLMDKKVYSI